MKIAKNWRLFFCVLAISASAQADLITNVPAHLLTGVWVSDNDLERVFEVRPNGEWVNGLWFGQRQALGVLANQKNNKGQQPVKITRPIEIEWRVKTPIGVIHRTLKPYEVFVPVQQDTELVLGRTINPDLSASIESAVSGLFYVSKIPKQRSERLSLKK